MRLAPKSLAGQLTLLLLLALTVAQGVAVALFAWERIEALRDAHRDNAVARTATVVRLLRGTPPALHESVVAAASTGSRAFRWRRSPWSTRPGPARGPPRLPASSPPCSMPVRSGVKVAPLWTRYMEDDDDWTKTMITTMTMTGTTITTTDIGNSTGSRLPSPLVRGAG